MQVNKVDKLLNELQVNCKEQLQAEYNAKGAEYLIALAHARYCLKTKSRNKESFITGFRVASLVWTLVLLILSLLYIKV